MFIELHMAAHLQPAVETAVVVEQQGSPSTMKQLAVMWPGTK